MQREQIGKLAWQWRGVLAATPMVAIAIVILRLLGLLQGWEWAIYDAYLRSRPLRSPDNRVAIVGIDEADLDRVGAAIVPDGVYAELIKKLSAQKPVAIGLDAYRDEPVEPGHAELVEVFKTTPNLIGIAKIIGDRDRDTVPPPPALAEVGRFGSNDLLIDPDGKIRRALLSLESEHLGSAIGFGLYLAGFYLDRQEMVPELTKAGNWQFGETIFQRFQANDGAYVRADAGGNQILLNYRGPSRHFEQVSLRDVLDEKIPPDWARDRIILIGLVGESSNDFFFNPYSDSLFSLPDRMAGVEVHANVTSQILSTVLDGQPSIRTWPDLGEWIWIVLWSAVGAVITWTRRYASSSPKDGLRLVGGLIGAGLVLLATTYVAFLQGWWIPLVPPLLALAGSSIAITTYMARTAGDIRKTFGRYLTNEVVANLLEHPEGLKLGGERRKITILTSDLRGFTSLSERLLPEDSIKIVNCYLSHMAEIINVYQGTIDEFMGDGILVFFGAPTAREDDARRAIACAIAMQQAMTAVNQEVTTWGMPALEMGIAINTGEVVVGNIGSEKRTKYGAMGAQVNLTYRIESYTTGGQILVSETTLREAGDDIRIDDQKEVLPKGVRQPVVVFDISGIGGEYNLTLSHTAEHFRPIDPSLSLLYSLLNPKNSKRKLRAAKIVELSERGAKVIGNPYNGAFHLPAELADLRLNFLDLKPAIETGDDVYAKVLAITEAENSFYLRFTAVPPAIHQRLQQIYRESFTELAE